MKDLYLALANLKRRWSRLILNSFAIMIAFLLFGVLSAVKLAFNAGIDQAADDRLVVVNKINLTQPLPYPYLFRLKSIEGVEAVTHSNWFGSYYQEPKNQVVGFAVDADSYVEVYPDMVLEEDIRNSWMDSRQGMIIGKDLAKKYGWQVGDKVPMNSSIFTQYDGSNTWDLFVSGIFTDEDSKASTNYFLFHYKYFIETQSFGQGWVGTFTVKTKDPVLNEQVIKAIDAKFANSGAETKTSSEKAFSRSFLEQLGSIGLIITSVTAAAFFTILLIVGNTMALAVRERTNEIAVLKVIGFSSFRIFKIILAESISMAIIGGLLGITLAYFMVQALINGPIGEMLPGLIMNMEVYLTAVAYMIGLGFVTGFFPALRAMRLNIVDALSRG